jgi:uncharacterized protein (TIGR00251 family)
MILKVKVIPRAKKAEIIELAKDFLKIKLSSPPIKNKANKELIELLSEYYHVSKKVIKIKQGIHSRDKLIEIKE